jgi:hypothetical protein
MLILKIKKKYFNIKNILKNNKILVGELKAERAKRDTSQEFKSK